MVNLEFYQGARQNTGEEDALNVIKSATPSTRLIDELSEDVVSSPFRFYFDNLFTGMNQLYNLKSLQFGAAKTIRQNRIPKKCPIMDSNKMKKKPRGTYDYASNGRVTIVKWKDNQVVSITSTAQGYAPLSTTGRNSRLERKRIQVSVPRVFLEYKKAMGGTDQMDGNVPKYRTGIRSKKWWWPIFTWLIDVSIHNAWILMKSCGICISHLNFKRNIVQNNVSRSGEPCVGNVLLVFV